MSKIFNKTLFVYQRKGQDPALLGVINYMRESGAALLKIKKKYNRFEKGEMIDFELMKKINQYQPSVIIFWLLRVNKAEILYLKTIGYKVSVVINGFASFSSGLSRDQVMGIEALRMLDAYFVPQSSHLPQLREMNIKAIHLPLWASSGYRPLKFWWPFKVWDFIFVGNFGANDLQGEHRRKIIQVFEKAGKVLIISDKKISRNVSWIPSFFGSEWLIRICSNLSYAGIASDFFPGIDNYNNSYCHRNNLYKLKSEYCIRPRSYCYYHQGLPFFVEASEESLREFNGEKTVFHWSDFDELHDKINYFLSSQIAISKIARLKALENASKYMISERFTKVLNWIRHDHCHE